jgi:serine/threonine protein kinase
MGQKLEKLGRKSSSQPATTIGRETVIATEVAEGGEEENKVVAQKNKRDKQQLPEYVASRFPVLTEKLPFLSVYQLEEEIIQGEGSFFTSTRKCRRKRDGGMFLAKRVEGREAILLHRKKIVQEVALLQNMQLRPRSIVHLEAFFETEKEIVLVFPLAVTDLYDHLAAKKRLQTDEIRYLVREVLEAVGYLHANHILHRNLKTEVVLFMDVTKPAEERRAVVMTSMPLLINVLREIVCEYEELPPRTLLTGFSLCELLDEKDTVLSFAGTPEYMAPEVVKQNPAGTPSDMWGVGCMMFELFEGRPPYYNENVTQMFQLISACAPLNFFHTPLVARELMTQLLSPIPEVRPTAPAVLSHAFFSERDRNLTESPSASDFLIT